MGVVEEALRLVLEIKGAAEGQGLEPRGLAQPSSRSASGPSDNHVQSHPDDGSPTIIDEARDGINSGEGFRGPPFSPTGRDGSADSLSWGRAVHSPGPGLDPGDSPSALTASPSPDDLVVNDRAVISGRESRDEDGSSGEEARQGEGAPAGIGSDRARMLEQLPALLRRLQERTDAVEEAVNRALDQLIRTQEMMASRLMHLNQKSRQSFGTAEQVGDYLAHPGPSALNFGGP